MAKILIVDDSRMILLALSRQLEKAGYEVATQPEALGVLQTIVREKPRLLILDITMPGLQGNTLCRMLRNEGLVGSELRVVLHSALIPEELAGKASQWGAHAFMEKCWRLPRKLEVIAELLGQVAEVHS
jgi:CheY-like chemotaxis protein